NKYLPVDVLIIGRGGGSLEDLWAFNEEVVVRAVAFSKIPTITAVGHETDFTLVDFAADLRAATPSQAAELAVYDLIDYKRKVEELYKRNYNALKYKFTSVKLQAERLANAQVLKEPERYLSEREITLDNLELRMVSALKMILQKQEYYYSLLTSRLDANSPLSILSKGYTVVQNEKSGHLIKSVEDVQQGLRIVTNLQDGKIVSEVKSVERSK
ncbi:MAG TPA: exodeoxyribonuclease VII large subunit, partial [Candidatus Avacidaminococcus intestinavium]|nr:exodeoxyribonuclease VII large subunit [Candidatus Avacidaminococcus intestinavium]